MVVQIKRFVKYNIWSQQMTLNLPKPVYSWSVLTKKKKTTNNLNKCLVLIIDCKQRYFLGAAVIFSLSSSYFFFKNPMCTHASQQQCTKYTLKCWTWLDSYRCINSRVWKKSIASDGYKSFCDLLVGGQKCNALQYSNEYEWNDGFHYVQNVPIIEMHSQFKYSEYELWMQTE